MKRLPSSPSELHELQQWIQNLLEAHAHYTVTEVEKLVQERAAKDGIRLRGALAKPVGIASGATATPTFVPGAFLGAALSETTGVNPATLTLTDRVTGDLIMPYTLAPNESARDWFGPVGIAYTTGLSVAYTGSVSGVIFLHTGPDS